MGHWTPTGIEPTDYDDDDDFYNASHSMSLSEAFAIKPIYTVSEFTR